MKAERWRQIEEIFQQAVELPPGRRESFLLRAAGNDPALRSEIDALLAAHEQSGSFLEEPVVEGGIGHLIASREVEELPKGRIGPYRLLRSLGEGGMSRVYLAVRDDDEYQKLVAVKVIRQGMDREDLRHRFRTERQILASLDHPNIAKLLDGGTTDDGLPYFVMDYIEGVPIDEYCDESRLPVTERLELFRTVCAAVQYAHQGLVVHRDLKASNILVTTEGVPKLLDFGIAKLIKPEQFPVAVELTATRLRPMTPSYASPEQVRGHHVTTSTDVYSLGVLLYKLLTGRLPSRLENKTQGEIERVILEQEPLPPSEMIGEIEEEDSPAASDRISRARGMQSVQLKRRLAGDLDNIVLMALRKEPQRRYASVEQLSEDIRRHLLGLPVIAHKDSLGYRTRKFVRRNLLPIGVAAAFVAMLGGFAIFWRVQASLIALERDQAQRERERAEEVVEFLQSIFQISDPHQAQGETITAREILDRGATRVEQELKEQPAVQATLMEAIGNVYRNLGLYDWARPLLERSVEIRRAAVGTNHPEYARSLSSLGRLLSQTGDFESAQPLLQEALKRRSDLFGMDHPLVAESLYDLARLNHDKGNFELAERLYRQALEVQGRALGADHPDLAENKNYLAILLTQRGDYEQAESLFRQAVDTRRRWLGPDHPLLADSLNDLGVLLGITGKYAEAEPLFREAFELRRRVLGEDHPAAAESLNNLGRLLRETGDLEGAEKLYREGLGIYLNVLGERHPQAVVTLNNLAIVLTETGKYGEAEELLRRALRLRREMLNENHPDIGFSLTGLARLLTRKGEPRDAEELLLQAIEIFQVSLRPGHWRMAEAQSLLGEALRAQGEYEQAEPILTESYHALRGSLGPEHRRTRDAAARLVQLYVAWSRPEKAAEFRPFTEG